MGLDTNTNVERLSSVLDENGNNVNPANANIQQAIRDALANDSQLHAETISAGTDGATGSDTPVPDGVTVAVQASNGNDAIVTVGPDGNELYELPAGAGIGLDVGNLSAISATAESGTQTVNLLMEDS